MFRRPLWLLVREEIRGHSQNQVKNVEDAVHNKDLPEVADTVGQAAYLCFHDRTALPSLWIQTLANDQY